MSEELMSPHIWVLGAPDPEMATIESLLRECGQRIEYARDERGERVRPGNAYRAARPPIEDVEYRTVYAVECGGDWFGGTGCVRIDHHRPGDPGYGRPPEEFLQASSLGQVIASLARLDVLPWKSVGGIRADGGVGAVELDSALGWIVGLDGGITVIPRDLVLTAAADHCLGAAYRGECPGVDPDELMRWRAESRAAFQRRPVEAVLADVARAQEALQRAPRVDLDGPAPLYGPDTPFVPRAVVADMRQARVVPELPEAATRLDIPYVSGPLVGPDGRRKITCSGPPEVVRAFLETWAPREGLVDTYGDPQRGFAAGYMGDAK